MSRAGSGCQPAADSLLPAAVRVGPETVTDPASLVPRALEDHVTWVDSSKIRRVIARYAGREDDFELLGE